ncbi:hypothetical protein HDU76_007696 [Blyttiomyces sp. JEL0837]|nr:hypothetical protein HDU76_007696 [Blyttiomyces sp. JEL0837]
MSYRRESKHWVSRTWLVLMNTLLLLIGVLALWVGAAALKLVLDNQATVTSGNDSIQVMTKGTAIGIIAYGGFLAVTALCGCFGGMTRANGLLGFYIGALIFDIFLTLGYGGYLAYLMKKNADYWKNLTLPDWLLFDDLSKDYVQATFNCCGFDGTPSSVYTGEVLYTFNGRTSNQCADPATVQTAAHCYDAGVSATANMFKFTCIALGTGIILLIISIGAATHARRREYAETTTKVYIAQGGVYQPLNQPVQPVYKA